MSRKAPTTPAEAAHETPPSLTDLEARAQERLATAQAEVMEARGSAARAVLAARDMAHLRREGVLRAEDPELEDIAERAQRATARLQAARAALVAVERDVALLHENAARERASAATQERLAQADPELQQDLDAAEEELFRLRRLERDGRPSSRPTGGELARARARLDAARTAVAASAPR